MGLFKTKSEKALKKLQKLKVKYKALDDKLVEGTINKKEYDEYNKLKEEITTMATKFEVKDGNLVLKDEATNNKKEIKTEDKIKEQVQKEKNESEQLELERQKMLEQERIKQQEELLKQQMTQTRQPTAEEIQQYMAMRQEQERQAQAQQGPSQEEIDRYHEYQAELARRQQAQMQQAELAKRQQPQPQQVEDRYLEVILNVAEMPELSAIMKLSTVPVFEKTIMEAINEKKTFPFGDYMLHGKYIIAYRFSEIDEREKQQYMEGK